jgi:hypothetical protein
MGKWDREDHHVIQPTLIRGHFAVWLRMGQSRLGLVLQAQSRGCVLREPLG